MTTGQYEGVDFLSKEWYKSKTMWGLIVVLAATVAQKFGLDIDLAGADMLLTEALQVAGAAYSLYGRVKATHTIK